MNICLNEYCIRNTEISMHKMKPPSGLYTEILPRGGGARMTQGGHLPPPPPRPLKYSPAPKYTQRTYPHHFARSSVDDSDFFILAGSGDEGSIVIPAHRVYHIGMHTDGLEGLGEVLSTRYVPQHNVVISTCAHQHIRCAGMPTHVQNLARKG